MLIVILSKDTAKKYKIKKAPQRKAFHWFNY